MIHYQGDMDRLCGVYAVMNAVGAMAGQKLGKERYSALFKVLCDRLMAEGKLPSVLYGGMSDRTVKKLMESACQFINAQAGKPGLGFSFPFRGVTLVTSEDFFYRLTQQASVYGEGSIMLRLLGKYDHWTCVQRITERNIHLLDSIGLQRLPRHRCATSEGDGLHILVPQETVFIFHAQGANTAMKM
ncbi:MAG: hypothetical protein HQL78_07835 [Magnetococcales bacterium]|nr:hypothetical protein [Magnetococcales bacterium]